MTADQRLLCSAYRSWVTSKHVPVFSTVSPRVNNPRNMDPYRGGPIGV